MKYSGYFGRYTISLRKINQYSNSKNKLKFRNKWCLKLVENGHPEQPQNATNEY